MTGTDTHAQQLVQAWVDGQPGADQPLMRHHFPVVFRFFDLNVPDHDVSDLVQDTFVAALAARERYDPGRATFRAFLLGIARHKLYKWHAAMARGRAEARDADQLARSSRSPSEKLALREESRLLLSALQTLPMEQQLTLQLHYWEGLTTGEVATVLDVAPGTIKSRLIRARDALREAILSADASEALKKATSDGLERWARAVGQQVGREESQK